MTEYEQILHEQRDDIVLLTLNRPQRLNAWTPRMSAELVHAIRAANGDSSVGAVVLTGAGRGFCAGADIGEQFAPAALGDGEAPAADVDPETGNWVDLCRESKPLVAAINGPAIGVGLTMVLPFDVLVAAEGAKLSVRFVKMGVVPELASSHFLVSRCGWGAASYLALSGATVLAEEARDIRLVDRVVPPERVVDEAIAVASEIAANPPPSVRMAKQLLTRNAVETDLGAVQRREAAALAVAYKTPEHAEAVRAFLEKRPPKFR
ncbi:MAG TPA: enoyl-CoA hydratase-related protein [Acidimicrobiales bacterium]|nr:enoyl-CoA hydratase-related protein [Acidimicrobiales bacterium]